eukprot:g6166.t1
MKRVNNGSRRYHVWSESEEQALKRGVRLYGVGAWEVIRQDESFSVLKHRSGVQLKDKWRNLVKFRKVDDTELRNLPRRLSGPWSKKSQFVDLWNDRICSNHERETHGDLRRRNRRLEDRRYGIYDFRRYINKPLSRGFHSSNDSFLTENPLYTVACLCGVDHDDGQRMIECEKCKEWVHTACLEEKEKIPIAQIEQYICWKCQQNNNHNHLMTVCEDTSSISDYDVWFPLQINFQSKGQRRHRRPRSEFNSLCKMIRSFQEQKWMTHHDTLLMQHPIKNKNQTIVGGYNGGRLSVTTAAYILTEQLKTLQSDVMQSNPKKQRFAYYYSPI